jgi:3D (Asp-Asp-Asp) domain-containing protein
MEVAALWVAQRRMLVRRKRPLSSKTNSISAAGGISTFADPIILAAAEGNGLLPAGTLVYVTGLRKYFLVEAICGNCTSKWIDIWMERDATSGLKSLVQVT